MPNSLALQEAGRDLYRVTPAVTRILTLSNNPSLLPLMTTCIALETHMIPQIWMRFVTVYNTKFHLFLTIFKSARYIQTCSTKSGKSREQTVHAFVFIYVGLIQIYVLSTLYIFMILWLTQYNYVCLINLAI